uniref:non-specific serine/threonine protein kinase n=1 Tax=Tetraodon nigroviridis TaxID=99883 RepID=H3DPY7_TETNG
RQTPSPGEGRGRGLKPGGRGTPPPEEPFGGFKLKAVPLKFIKKLQDIVLKEAESIGSSAVFECEVSPSTAVTSWMKDGGNLRESPKHKFTSDGKDRKLNIIDVQLSDTGEYTCVAKNAGKEISCMAKLIVEELPVKWIKELEEETSALKGQPLYVTCELNKERDVIWKKDGEVLKKKAGKIQINVIGMRHVLEIKEVTLDDTCQIKAEAKGIPSMANLTVIEGDAYFTVKLQDYTAVEKDKVVLDCELNKDVDVMWYHNEAEIRPSKMVSIKADGKRRSLIISRVTDKDEGQYVCDCGTDKTSATLHIKARHIKVLRPMYGAEVFEGETARFEVELSEDDVHGQWSLNGELLSPSSVCHDIEIVEDGPKHTLVLYNCRVPQTGEVVFTAANAKCSANLKVKEIPISFITPLADVYVYEKDEARFELEISREPKNFRWLKGPQELVNDDKFELLVEGKKHILLIKSAKYEDEAKYTFEAEDKRTSGKLFIQGIRLDFIKPIKDVTVKERETAEFSTELSHEKIPVVWYKNEVRLHPSKVVHITEDGKVHMLAFKELTVDDTSMIKVEAMGKSSEAMLTVLEGDVYFTVKLQNYTAVEKDEAILSCELSKATADVKWFKDGEEVFPSKNILIKSDGKKRMLVIKKAAKSSAGTYTCSCATDKTTSDLNIEGN